MHFSFFGNRSEHSKKQRRIRALRDAIQRGKAELPEAGKGALVQVTQAPAPVRQAPDL